jgi:hypothetical protein
MPRGRFPTGTVATTLFVLPSMMVTSSDSSLLTQTQKPRAFGWSAGLVEMPSRSAAAASPVIRLMSSSYRSVYR